MKCCVGVFPLLHATLSFAQSQAPSAPPKVTYLRCGALHDDKSDSARKNITFRIVGEKIDQIAESLQPEAGAIIIDLGHEVCLPGIQLSGLYSRREYV